MGIRESLDKVVESGGGQEIYHNPQHPYTKSLMSAIPVPNPHKKSQRQIITGDVPSPINPPAGCSFHPRCPVVQDNCKQDVPKLVEVALHNAALQNKDSNMKHEASCLQIKGI